LEYASSSKGPWTEARSWVFSTDFANNVRVAMSKIGITLPTSRNTFHVRLRSAVSSKTGVFYTDQVVLSFKP